MRLSIRHRLVAVAALAALACAAALFAIDHLVRTGREQRIDRAHELVTREVERLRDESDLPPTLRRPRLPPNGQSGYLSATLDPYRSRPPGPFVRDAVLTTARSVDGSTEPVVHEFQFPQAVAVVAVVALPNGGYAWAIMRVPVARVLEGWRIGVFVLALASLALVVATLQTLFAFQRGVSTLRSGLSALSQNLRAPVERPRITELSEVAEGIAGLAEKLSASHDKEDLLRRELAVRERLASLGRVAAGLAHEVRNPLAAIKLRVDLAQRSEGLPATLSRDLGDVSSEIARLDRLVADLLTVAGRKTGPRVETDLEALAHERVSLLAPVANERTISIEVQGAATAAVDRDALARALDNLVRNAVDASPDGSTVHVEIGSADGRATLAVADHGPGVPEGRVAELFEPFFTTKPEGTGLGLALSRAIAEAHSGSLTYERRANQTRFVMNLPVKGP